MADPLKDPRFAHLSWHPKFSRVPKVERKVKIDDRFKSMFTDSKFQTKTKVDKRGRSLKRSTNEDLQKYYALSSESEENDESKNEECKSSGQSSSSSLKMSNEQWKEVGGISEDESSSDKLESDQDHESAEIRLDLARGEGNFESSSSDDNSDSEWEFQDGADDMPEHPWGELDAHVPEKNEVTRRLAACNMDWDRIKAKDLLVLFNSFKPTLGLIKSVAIYPSEFGLKRMEEEKFEGPKELIDAKKVSRDSNDNDDVSTSDSQSENEDDEAHAIQREKIRQYQLNRLKYFYAIVECDSSETANAIYEACDGVEYESSATKLDLRFIPDDMTFDESLVKEEAKDLNDLSSYKPMLFRNAALQQSKVELTWDETDTGRSHLMKRAFDDENSLDNMQINEILASGSSDDDEDAYNKRKIDLLEDNDDGCRSNDEDVDLEVKWEPGSLSANTREHVDAVKSLDNEELDDAVPANRKEKFKKETSNTSSATPWQDYLAKRREKRQHKRDELERKRQESRDLNAGVVDVDQRKKNKIGKFAYDTNVEDVVEESEENKRNRQQLELLLADNSEDSRHHYNLHKLLLQREKGKGAKRKIVDGSNKDDQVQSEDFTLNVTDPRFEALYTSHVYNIDPSDPAFKKTKNMEILVEEKMKRSKASDGNVVDKATNRSCDSDANVLDKKPGVCAADLSLLVKSVKSKSRILQEQMSKKVKKTK